MFLGTPDVCDPSPWFNLKAHRYRTCRLTRTMRRRPVSASTGYHVVGAVSPKPDTSDHCSIGSGCQFRLCRNKKRPRLAGLKLAARVVVALLEARRVKPLPITPLIPSKEVFEEWLAGTTYGEERKDELRDAWGSVYTRMCTAGNHASLRAEYQNFVVKLFAKEEHYTKGKQFRGIYARNDPAKVLFGHFISDVEDVVYKWPEFIKKVPIHERPALLKSMFPDGAQAIESDYTSWEAHFHMIVMGIEALIMGMLMSGIKPNLEYFDTWLKAAFKQFMQAKSVKDLAVMEFLDFKKLFQGADPTVLLKLSVFFSATALTNKVKGKRVSMLVHALRMSGEMTTSLLNGLMNLVYFVTIYCASVAKAEIDDPDIYNSVIEVVKREFGMSAKRLCVVEGDDLLGSLRRGVTLNPVWYEHLGLNIKFDVYNCWADASFCGLRCDPESLQIICDVQKALGNFGWVAKRYALTSALHKRKLAKIKALSYAYQYPGCPIINVLSQRVLDDTWDADISRLLSSSDAYGGKWWQRSLEKYVRAMDKRSSVPFEEPTARTRALFAEVNGVPVEAQLAAEDYIRNSPEPDGLYLTDWIKFEPDQCMNYRFLVRRTCGESIQLAASSGGENRLVE